MPQTGKPDRRKHLIILLIAIIIALVVLLIRAETASAHVDGYDFRATNPGEAQITAEDYQRAVTTERLMILGMLALVVLTWFYLRWRPPPGAEPEAEDMEDDRQR